MPHFFHLVQDDREQSLASGDKEFALLCQALEVTMLRLRDGGRPGWDYVEVK